MAACCSFCARKHAKEKSSVLLLAKRQFVNVASDSSMQVSVDTNSRVNSTVDSTGASVDTNSRVVSSEDHYSAGNNCC